jgi:hypothetical protein
MYDKPAVSMWLMVEARGMAQKLFKDVPTFSEELATMRLTDGATIRGRVVENGKPVAGVEMLGIRATT